MIDVHCHILPGLDDGPETMELALQMARIASDDGITDIVATPHTHNGFYMQTLEHVLTAVEELQCSIDQEGIELRVHPGMEIHIHLELIDHLRDLQILSMGNRMRHVLLELPTMHLPMFTEELVQQLLLSGITPIIAHPERNATLMQNPGRLARWIDAGVIAQLTAGSLLGWMGRTAKKNARELIEQRLVQLIATDGHNCTTRKVQLSKAYEELGKLLTDEELEVFRANALAVLHGEACQAFARPEIPIEKKWLFFF